MDNLSKNNGFKPASQVKSPSVGDPPSAFTTSLASLGEDLFAAFPSPPYESDDQGKQSMCSPSNSSNSDTFEEFNMINFSDMLEDEAPLFGGNLLDENVCEEAAKEVNDELLQNINVVSDDDEVNEICKPAPFDENDSENGQVSIPVTTQASEPTKYTLRVRKQPVLPESMLKTIRISNATQIKPAETGGKWKRPRQRHDSDEIEDADKSNKAAIQARVNRQKKKAYIQGLEGQVQDLSSENATLKHQNKRLDKERSKLLEEVDYLKGVLSNDSMLAGLLQNIGNSQQVRLTTSFNAGKRYHEHDHDYGQARKKVKVQKKDSSVAMSGGVCLHVENNNVSLEFCAKCAKMSRGAGRGDDS